MAQFPSTTSASDIWSLLDAYRARAGENWPSVAAPVSLAWTTNYGNTTTITSSTVVTATSANNSNSYGYFSGLLPTYSCYLDIIINAGYSNSPTVINFLGISNEVSQFTWGIGSKYKAWYWSGDWRGDGTNYVTPPAMNADTYRIAVNRENGRLYMKRTGDATIASANLPTGSNLYVVNLALGGYPTSGATIVNGLVYSGAGGLY